MSVFAVYLIFSMLAVIWYDGTRYVIPNWLSASLLLLYPVAVLMSHGSVDWKMATVGMVIVFAVGYLVFAMKWMGGGDVKLITVCSLWVGLHNLTDFIFLFALLGGVFSVGVLGIRKIEPFLPKKPDARPMPRILRQGEPIPYGVVIAAGFLMMMWWGEVAGIL